MAGKIAGDARKKLEKKLGRSIVLKKFSKRTKKKYLNKVFYD
jgi:hypothetical protein